MPALYRNRQPRYRAERRRAMKAQGITPTNRQQVWGVKFIAGNLAARSLAQHRIPALAIGGYVWLKVRHAKLAVKMGWARQVIKTEFKRCLLCHRPLIANEAERYRKLLESSPDARSLPCGPRCEQERSSRLWDRLIA
jgi:hypothetical protein